MKIETDLFFASAERIMVKPKPIQLPSQWVLSFHAEIHAEMPYERSYGFSAKPTRKQIKDKRKNFKVCLDMHLNYI